MGFFSGVTDWIGDTVSDAFGAVGDAFEWVGEKVKDVWNSKLGKIAVIVAASYLAAVAVTGSWSLGMAAETAPLAGTGIESAGAGVLSEASATAQLGVSSEGMAIGESFAGGGSGAGGGFGGIGATTASDIGVAEAAQAAAASESVAGTAAGVDLSLSGGAAEGIGTTFASTGASEGGVLSSVEAFAAEHPMMAYGGMMAGGQAVSGYMAGEQQKQLEQQRLKEEQANRDRQNVWGVNYGTGEGEAVNAGERLKNLNRDYFDSAAPLNVAKSDFNLKKDRERSGILNEIAGRANPEQFKHRTGA